MGGLVQAPPVVVGWKIALLQFPLLNGGRSAMVDIAYVKADDSLDHSEQLSVTGEAYRALLASLSTPVAGETALIIDGVPDLPAILNFRLSSYLVGAGLVPYGTAEPILTDGTIPPTEPIPTDDTVPPPPTPPEEP